ncbi:hypothetical protein LOY91_005492 [Ophidiomyces ophidiicola]|nr:hypothetical protein LOY91_005492 [Ophidiomyces ophidiicola]
MTTGRPALSRSRVRRTAKTQRDPPPAYPETNVLLRDAKLRRPMPSYSFAVDQEALVHALHLIASHPSLTPYRRLVYRTLLSVPTGRWTTYAVLSAHLSSSARAVGNAMKTNPFAPEVPCHRVLATDRTIGGYKGKWGNGGQYSVEKTKLLTGEGVVFDSKGRASGDVFREFVDMGAWVTARRE